MIYGANIDGERIFNDPKLLEEDLAYISSVGFDFAEIGIEGLEVISGGKLIEERVKEIREITSKFDLGYVIHSPDKLNLASLVDVEIERYVLRSTVDFMALIGAKLLVLHPGYVPNELLYRYLPIRKAHKIFIDSLKGIAAYSRKHDITICVENLPPYLDRYLFGDRIDMLVSIIEEVDEENVKICYDFGHGYSSSNYYLFDFTESIRIAKEHIHHLHVNDTYGKQVDGTPGERLGLKGELMMGLPHHLPLGWGEVPYKEGLLILKDKKISITLELYPRYRGYYKRNLEELKSFVEGPRR
jgi:sugar phosphate isomerase/epimerase